MSGSKRSIATLLLASALLFMGVGLQATFLPLRAQFEGFSTSLIGAMGTAYFAGFAIGCIFGPAVVKSVGHIRAFAGFAALAAGLTLLLPIWPEPILWCLLRALSGVCFAILYIVVESWLNDQASNRVRGTVLSLYIIITNIVTVGGQLMVNLAALESYILFSAIAILIALSLVPLCLTDTATPKPVPSASLDLAALFRLSPSGFVGCLAVGLVEGAFWSLGPVYGKTVDFSIAEVTFFMSAFVVGGTLSQWPLGAISDRIDRRRVIALCCIGTMTTGLTLAFVALPAPWMVYGLALVHGAFMIPIYPLCLAHANDYAPAERLVQTSGGLLLIYGGGAVAGPALVGPLMQHRDPGMLFLFIAVLLALLALFIVYRSFRRKTGPDEYHTSFVPVPKTSISVYSLETDDPEGWGEETAPAPDEKAP